jgi:hypothetical protein
MENREGILDEIEELVNNFEKTGRLPDILTEDYIKNIMECKQKDYINYSTNCSIPLTTTYYPYEQRFLKQLTQRQIFRQEHPNKDFNRVISHHCQCGEKFSIFMWEQLTHMDYINRPALNVNTFEKDFFCSKCGRISYIRSQMNFNIVDIKYDENFII